jgi:hypothetical protein
MAEKSDVSFTWLLDLILKAKSRGWRKGFITALSADFLARGPALRAATPHEA